jgi:CubicO group peptidase (beta-lactamase class C family)
MFFSITKLFTATAVMTLVDEGRIDLDQPIDAYVPDLALVNPFDTPLTVRHLLNHSSGLPNPPAWSWAHLHDRPRPRLRAFLDQVLAENGRLEAEPGTRDEYNNIAYLILGRLIEDVSGEPYEDYVRARIIEPLEMEHTDFVYRDDMLARAAIGVVARNSIYHRLFRRVAPPELFGPEVGDYATARLYLVDGASYAGLVGTAPDLSKFAAMHLAGGTWHGERILSEASVRAMQAVQHGRREKPLSHTLGWHTGVIGGERYFNHMGRGGGFRPAIRIYPGLGYGIVVLTNRTNYDPKPITQRVPIEGTSPDACTD